MKVYAQLQVSAHGCQWPRIKIVGNNSQHAEVFKISQQILMPFENQFKKNLVFRFLFIKTAEI